MSYTLLEKLTSCLRETCAFPQLQSFAAEQAGYPPRTAAWPFGWALSLGAPALLSGCLTEFPPLRPFDETSDSSESTASTSETSARSTSTGATSEGPDGGTELDASVDGSVDAQVTTDEPEAGTHSSDTTEVVSCGAGETACGATCVRGDSCCETSCEAANGTGECRDQKCVIAACEKDFVDCDGAFDNGCEMSLAAPEPPSATEGDPLPVPQFDYAMGISEIEQSAWVDVPRYRLNGQCVGCEASDRPESVPPITPETNRGALPSTSDLRGTFALAWNDLGLWLNVVIVDDRIVSGEDIDETDPRLYDDVMVVWDSEAGESDSGSGNDRILFAGLDERLKDWRQSSATGAAVRVSGAGQCRSVHIQLTPQYLFMGSGGAGALDTGDQYGLDVGYNDFDWAAGSTTEAERQHLVMGLPVRFASGEDYHTGVRTLPQVELVGP